MEPSAAQYDAGRGIDWNRSCADTFNDVAGDLFNGPTSFPSVEVLLPLRPTHEPLRARRTARRGLLPLLSVPDFQA